MGLSAGLFKGSGRKYGRGWPGSGYGAPQLGQVRGWTGCGPLSWAPWGRTLGGPAGIPGVDTPFSSTGPTSPHDSERTLCSEDVGPERLPTPRPGGRLSPALCICLIANTLARGCPGTHTSPRHVLCLPPEPGSPQNLLFSVFKQTPRIGLQPYHSLRLNYLGLGAPRDKLLPVAHD